MARLREGLFGSGNTNRVTAKASDICRPLGPLEHLFWWRSVHFAVTAQIAGTASPGDWRDALDRVQARHPILSVRIEGSPASVPRFRREDAAPIPLRIVEGDPKTRWESEVGEELATPFDPSRAPLIRAVLIDDGRDTGFILAAHHSVADGLSLSYAIRDTLAALSGEVLEPLPLLPAQEEMLGAGPGPAALADAHERPDSSPDGGSSTDRRPDGAPPSVKSLRLTSDLTTSLKDCARQEGTTVHGALSAAVAIAGRLVSANWRHGAVRIMSAINTRPFLEVGESFGLFASWTTRALDVRPTGFWELARHAKAATAIGQTRESVAALHSRAGEALGQGAESAALAEFAAEAFGHEAMVSNLGVLNLGRRFGALTLESAWGPAIFAGMPGAQTIGVATFDGSICLTHTSSAPAEGLLEAMRRILADACVEHRHTSLI